MKDLRRLFDLLFQVTDIRDHISQLIELGSRAAGEGNVACMACKLPTMASGRCVAQQFGAEATSAGVGFGACTTMTTVETVIWSLACNQHATAGSIQFLTASPAEAFPFDKYDRTCLHRDVSLTE